MFRTISRFLFPNPLNWKLRKIRNKKKAKILICWNRGLGDIALGLYAIVHRIREKNPDAAITFLVRENLRDGCLMLSGVKVLTAPDWKRGFSYSAYAALALLGLEPQEFDLILEKPSPTDWVYWQRGFLVPRLQWNREYDSLWRKFGLEEKTTYIGIQPVAETQYGLWRNWPYERWAELLDRLEKIEGVKVLLFGYGNLPNFPHSNIIDLRGKTKLYELLSIIKHRCQALVLPDSGILSMVYYLDDSFPIEIISLWGDPNHGILKQGVFSPNPLLRHHPIVGPERDLSSVSASKVIDCLFPWKPLTECVSALMWKSSQNKIPCNAAVVILAGGQGSRLGGKGPKGLFPVLSKTLFQWVCEKIPLNIPVAIMTSPLNHAETVAFFEQRGNFGRDISFFTQKLLPLLDEKKQPTGMLGPDGNGGVFKELADSGMLQMFEQRGVDLLSIIPIDNPLADPVDEVFFSYLQESKADLAVKCIEQNQADPNMGALVLRKGRLEIVEYTEIDPSLEYPYRYAGMMACTLKLAKRLALAPMPLHWVWKKSDQKFAWKGEKFLFDALFFAERAVAFCCPRDRIYAPLKGIENLCRIEKILRGRESRNEVLSSAAKSKM